MSAEIPSGSGVLQRIQEVLGEYFAQVRRDSYVVDGVDEAEAAALVLASVNPNITTQDQLDALPHLALLLRPYRSQAGWSFHELWEKRHDVWHCLAAPLSPPARHDGVPLLPAILLWSPS